MPDHTTDHVRPRSFAGGGMSDAIARAQRAFVAHLRHELSTPLNAVIGYSEILLEEALPEDERFGPRLQEILEEGQGMLKQIQQIVGESHNENGVPDDFAVIGIRLRHELGIPLDSVITASESICREAANNGRHEVLVEAQKIQSAAERLFTLILAMVSYGLEDDSINSPAENVLVSSDVAPVIQDVVASLPSRYDREPLTDAGGAILIVDDSPTNRDLLSRRLSKQGFEVTCVDGGEEAFDLLKTQDFDLVLLDVIMPGMNGYEVLEKLKTSEEWRHIPVIMISSLDEMDSVVRCIELGAEDYLPKNFDPILLRARISASLEKKRLRDQEVHLFHQLEQNYQKLRELESLRDSLTHMVVHDLRTPLTSLTFGLQTLQMLGTLNEDQLDCLHISLKGGQTLLGMINDLLDVSKMEDGALHLQFERLDAATLLKTALTQVDELIKSDRLELTTSIPDDLPKFEGDEEKIGRTLVNLLGNAIKFTPRGGTLGIAVAYLLKGQVAQGTGDTSPDPEDGVPSLLFSISDTGEGIPKESFDKIFEKFGQVEGRQAGRRMSTGLGLTFCKMVVEAHGGRIWVESEVGEGSTFFFSIPVERSLVSAVETEA